MVAIDPAHAGFVAASQLLNSLASGLCMCGPPEGGAGCDTQSCRPAAPRASSCMCSPWKNSHFGAVGLNTVQKRRLHAVAFQRRPAMAPFLVAAVAPDSVVAMLDGPVLKIRVAHCHRPGPSSFSIGVRREDRQRGWLEFHAAQLAVELGGHAGGVSGNGDALSVGSQKSVEDPGAVTCGSSTCMLICESSRQSVLRRNGQCLQLCEVCARFSACKDTSFVQVACGFSESMACRTSTCHPLARTCVATLLERCSALHLGIPVSSSIARLSDVVSSLDPDQQPMSKPAPLD